MCRKWVCGGKGRRDISESSGRPEAAWARGPAAAELTGAALTQGWLGSAFSSPDSKAEAPAADLLLWSSVLSQGCRRNHFLPSLGGRLAVSLLPSVRRKGPARRGLRVQPGTERVRGPTESDRAPGGVGAAGELWWPRVRVGCTHVRRRRKVQNVNSATHEMCFTLPHAYKGVRLRVSARLHTHRCTLSYRAR